MEKLILIIVLGKYKIQNFDLPIKVTFSQDHGKSYKITPAFIFIVVFVRHDW